MGDFNGRQMLSYFHKTFLAILTLLVTIALAVGGYTLNQIHSLEQSKVSVREVDQMRYRLTRIEDKLDQTLNLLYEKRANDEKPKG